MDGDLAYYRRRKAEELAASRSSVTAARAAHRDLARLYDDRIAALEAPARVPDIHLVNAA